MNTNHTPGPWEWDAEPGHGVWVSSEDVGICQVDFDRALTDADYKANARLIAAAPDLLDAAQTAYKAMIAAELSDSSRAEWESSIAKLNQAIAKATGEKQ